MERRVKKRMKTEDKMKECINRRERKDKWKN